jgi:hypothetical protein
MLDRRILLQGERQRQVKASPRVESLLRWIQVLVTSPRDLDRIRRGAHDEYIYVYQFLHHTHLEYPKRVFLHKISYKIVRLASGGRHVFP